MDTASTSALAARLNLVGSSAAQMSLLKAASNLAPLQISVLLLGETGTGKSTVAKFIHHASTRAAHRFVSFNCAAVPDDLLESIFFGHERGAFTGALERAGLFEQAHLGTLLLDEIGELTPTMQAKLLTAIETKTIRRVGGNREIKFDVRLICATHRPLTVFRPDFLHRINKASLEVPSLRHRQADLPELVSFFFSRAQTELEAGSPFTLKPAALVPFSNYDWPGNIRELENFILKAALASLPEGVIEPSLVADTLAVHRRALETAFTPDERDAYQPVAPGELFVIPPYLLQHQPGETFDHYVARLLVAVHDHFVEDKGLTKTKVGKLLGIERSVLASRRKYALKLLAEAKQRPSLVAGSNSPA
jgi:DNA-binding NtrC family response regulator